MSFWDDVLLLDIFGGLKMTGRHLVPEGRHGRVPRGARASRATASAGCSGSTRSAASSARSARSSARSTSSSSTGTTRRTTQGKNEKVLDRFDVDLKRCMFCGLCEEACPTNPKSIWLRTKTYELGTPTSGTRPSTSTSGSSRSGTRTSSRSRVVERGGGGGDGRPFFFWFFAAVVVFGAVGVVAMRQPVHSALFLLLSFLGVAALFVLAQRRVPRRRPDPRLRGRHHGALPLHDHARERPAHGGRALRAPAGGRGAPRRVPPPRRRRRDGRRLGADARLSDSPSPPTRELSTTSITRTVTEPSTGRRSTDVTEDGRRQQPGGRPGASTATTCCRSRSRRSSCSSR